jgi:hypothetical protein
MIHPVSVPPAAAEETRESRAMETYLGFGGYVEQVGEGLFEVPSPSGETGCLVRYGGREEEYCTCEDFALNGGRLPCEHLIVLGIMHAHRRRRPHSFECAGCSARLPLKDSFVVRDEVGCAFEEGQRVCYECASCHGIL